MYQSSLYPGFGQYVVDTRYTPIGASIIVGFHEDPGDLIQTPLQKYTRQVF